MAKKTAHPLRKMSMGYLRVQVTLGGAFPLKSFHLLISVVVAIALQGGHHL